MDIVHRKGVTKDFIRGRRPFIDSMKRFREAMELDEAMNVKPKESEIELVQKIGNEVCDGCGPHRDCEIEPEECDRILNAIEILARYRTRKLQH